MNEQKLLLINKQILELALQQDDLNAVLGSMLSTAECLANRFGKNPKESFFESYNLYGSGNTKNEEDLKDQLEIQTKVFRNNHHFMLNKEGNYPFPENFGKTEIEQIVNFWKKNSKPENKIYFENIIKVLYKNYNLTYPEETTISNELDPNITLELFPKVMKDVNKSRKKVKQEVSQNGVYNNNLQLNGKCTDKNTGDLFNKASIVQNEKIIFIQYLCKIFKDFECYIYFIYYKNNSKLPTRLNYGNKEEYDKVLDKNASSVFAILNEDLEELKKAYEKYCSLYDVSKDKEIKKYKNSCINWMKNYSNDYYIKKLGEILIKENTKENTKENSKFSLFW